MRNGASYSSTSLLSIRCPWNRPRSRVWHQIMEFSPDLSRLAPNLSKLLLPWRPWVRSGVHLIPDELLSEIFLLVVEAREVYQADLMLVCWRWHEIVLATPGLHTQLRIRRATKKEDVQAFINRTKTRLHVFVDMNDESDGNEFDADNFHACFTAAAQVASRWRYLNLISPPPHGEYQDIHITQPLKHLEWFELASGFGNLVEPLVTAISQTAILTAMELTDPAAVLYLGQPSYLHIFNCLSLLDIRLPRRSMNTPVDVLPHLPRLQCFTAHHLYLPIYPPGASLPLTQTVERLSLKSTSIQWMGGQVFPALMKYSAISPHHADTIQPLQPVTMPLCQLFYYNSNDLSPLRHFHVPKIHNLDVRCGQWSVWRGNLQLIFLHSLVTASSWNLTTLHLDVQCSEQLLVCVLRLVPALYKLQLRLASPNALSKAFFQAFILREPDQDGGPGTVGVPKWAIDPLCQSLQFLHLQYKRWLRGVDSKELIPLFSDIVASHWHEEDQFSCTLEFDEDLSSWSVGTPEWKLQTGNWDVTVGILCPHAMIPMFTEFPESGILPLPFKEVDYLYLHDEPHNAPIGFHFTLDHMELSNGGPDQLTLQTPIPCDLPLFHALRVLVLVDTNPSFLAGHTFHRLERCSVMGSSELDHMSSQKLSTEMPVCTRVDIDDPALLATFMLPQIHELGLDFSVSDCGMIWENQILVMSNLSGLKLLHMRGERIGRDLVQILQPLPLLETLIISSQVDVETFMAMNQLSWEGQKLAIVCPLLQRFQVEDTDPSERPEWTPILEDVVTLRKMCDSPLKSFTFYIFSPEPGRKFELIGIDGGFTMEETVLAEYVEQFELDM